MQRSKPNTYTPPYPAFQQLQPSTQPDFVMAMLGVQTKTAERTLFSNLLDCLEQTGAGQPLHIEYGQQDDAQGFQNDILMPYWRTREDMEDFFGRNDVIRLLKTPLTGTVGLWAEQLAAPTTALDANNARPDVDYGIARYSEPKEEQYHAYMGSMRDRVPDFLAGTSDAEPLGLTRQAKRQTHGAVLEITDLPHNLCFIRGAFAWQEAGQEEQEAYLEKMWPVYRDGAEYLRDNPIESGCISMRMIEEKPLHQNTGIQSGILGWFLTLTELERWTRSHPRHLAIMKTIMAYMKEFAFKPKLHLGHEVVVVPQGQAKMVYNNCHEDTGFLPFFPSQVIG
ncbi:MAG: phenylacetaldoxime dehydratase family protein [Pseudomonadota bacterium]